MKGRYTSNVPVKDKISLLFGCIAIDKCSQSHIKITLQPKRSDVLPFHDVYNVYKWLINTVWFIYKHYLDGHDKVMFRNNYNF